jgi:anti-anti-sigma factor
MELPSAPVRTKHGFTIIAPEESLTVATLYSFRKTIETRMEKDEHFFALDFKNIQRIDSSALGLLRNISRKLSERSGMLCIFNAIPEINEMFTITDLQSLVRVFPGEKEFDEAFEIFE